MAQLRTTKAILLFSTSIQPLKSTITLFFNVSISITILSV